MSYLLGNLLTCEPFTDAFRTRSRYINLYFYRIQEDDFLLFDIDGINSVYAPFQLQNLLMKRWEESKQHAAMNYDLNCMYKLLPGDYNLSIQVRR